MSKYSEKNAVIPTCYKCGEAAKTIVVIKEDNPAHAEWVCLDHTTPESRQ